MRVKSEGNPAEVIEENFEKQRVGLLIDKPILDLLEKERMSINQLFVMLAMYEEHIGLLDVYDKKGTNRPVLILEYQDLQLHGFLQESNSNVMFELTKRGKEFVEKVKPLMQPDEKEMENAGKLRDLCERYLLIFPKVKLPSNKYARTNIIEVEKKMKSWIRDYKAVLKAQYGIILTDEVILTATKSYVERYAKQAYKFMATSSYFIRKDERSALADEIIANKQGLTQTKSNVVTM